MMRRVDACGVGRGARGRQRTIVMDKKAKTPKKPKTAKPKVTKA
jgi:hypothetical protein